MVETTTSKSMVKVELTPTSLSMKCSTTALLR